MHLGKHCTKLIYSLLSIAALLYSLLLKGMHWHWTAACNAAMNQLKHELTHASTLALLHSGHSFYTNTNANIFAMGRVLTQWIN